MVAPREGASRAGPVPFPPPPPPGAGQRGEAGGSPGHTALPWGQGWAEAGSGHGPGLVGCGKVESGPAAVSLGQELMALGAEIESWAVGRARRAPEHGQGWSGLAVSSGP